MRIGKRFEKIVKVPSPFDLALRHFFDAHRYNCARKFEGALEKGRNFGLENQKVLMRNHRSFAESTW